MAQAALKSCEICERGSGNNFCLSCEQFLCEDCKKLHIRQKGTKSHKFQSDSNAAPEVNSRCKEHNGDFIFICVQCIVPVCKKCVSGSHNGHNMAGIDDVIARLKKSVTKANKIGRVTQQLNIGLTSLESDQEDAIKKIKEEGVKIKELIDQEKMTRMLSELKKEENELQRQLEELTKKSEDVSLLEKLKAHMESLDSMMDMNVVALPGVKYSSKSINSDEINKLMGTYIIQELMTDTKLTSAHQQTRQLTADTKHASVSQQTRPVQRTKRIKHVYRCGNCGEEAVYSEIDVM